MWQFARKLVAVSGKIFTTGVALMATVGGSVANAQWSVPGITEPVTIPGTPTQIELPGGIPNIVTPNGSYNPVTGYTPPPQIFAPRPSEASYFGDPPSVPGGPLFYEYREPNGTYADFRQMDASRWINHSNGHLFNFIERVRTPDFVTLLDPSRNLLFQIRANGRAFWATPGGQWHYLANGSLRAMR